MIRENNQNFDTIELSGKDIHNIYMSFSMDVLCHFTT